MRKEHNLLAVGYSANDVYWTPEDYHPVEAGKPRLT